MRLLEIKDWGEFSLTRDLTENIPPYAILSHTWGADTDEVTFRQLLDGTGRSKAGYNKIRLCGNQARRDRLQYFWVDTCCIDKSNSTELSEAINSMFRWYRNAVKCYVYLSDVSRLVIDVDEKLNELLWAPEFRRSRWFTRGWTLQELIAPASVEFFSKDWEQIGNKASLEKHICEITGMPITALKGRPLSNFSITERMSWARRRQTTREEDLAYSLLGIFNICMPLIYGEGTEKAMKRLREEIGRDLKGIRQDDFCVAFSLSDVSDIEQFVGREKELVAIHKMLSGDGSRRTVVLHGLGGIGKTQTAVAYAKRHKDNYSAIFWLNTKDEYSLKQGFARIASQILREHPSASRLCTVNMEEDLDQMIDAVKSWLSLPNNSRWLMIYDNFDNPELPSNTDPTALDIRKFLPESYQGSVIITTRSSQVKIGHRLHITTLESARDSLEILSNTSGREGLINDPDAIRLVEQLNGLPLALATAGAYLDQVAVGISDYLRMYNESWAKLQKTSPSLSSYEDRTLYSTWKLSFDHIEQDNDLSAKLLRLWAYFDNQDLWFELLQTSNPEDPGWIRELTGDELSFHAAVRVLSDHGLVEVATSSQELVESRGYSIHECVHSWTIHVLNKEWDHDLAKVAVKFVGSHVPEGLAIRPWLTQQRLLHHAARCSYIILNGLVLDDGMEWAYHNLGDLYADHCRLDEAGKMYDRALLGKEKALGLEHATTLETVNNLGDLYTSQGQLDEAEKMYERALQGKEKAWGPDHMTTLSTVNNLGLLYKSQNRLYEAETMYERALQGSEKAWGPSHTSTLDIANNLGILYTDQGRLDEAEKIYQRALKGKEKALGPDHTSTLSTVNNLGALYANQGRLNEAEKMYERALIGKEKAWGLNHTSTLSTVNNLGILYADQGRLDEAEKMYERALEGIEKALGPDHTTTLSTVNSLGLLYKSQGRLDEAKKMYERALQGREKAWGPNHTSTLDTVNNLGQLYACSGQLGEAEKMYERALHGYEKALGPDHMSTLSTVNNLGMLYAVQGQIDEAEKMYERALQGSEKARGPNHTTTLSTLNNLGILYKSQGRLDEAEKIYKRTLQGYEKEWGPDHTSTLETVNNLGNLYVVQGRLDEAKKMYERALQGREKAWGPNHTSTLDTVNNLGQLYASSGQLGEAERMYERALHGYEKSLGSTSVTTYVPALNAVENLASLFSQTGRPEGAKELYLRAQFGLVAVFGPSSRQSRNIAMALKGLGVGKT